MYMIRFLFQKVIHASREGPRKDVESLIMDRSSSQDDSIENTVNSENRQRQVAASGLYLVQI